MTLVWGRPLVDGAVVATAELGEVTVDQAPLVEGRFTLIAPDALPRRDARGAALRPRAASEVARESLYEDDGEDDEE